MIDKLIQYDAELLIFLNNLGTPAWDSFWLAVTDRFTFSPLYLLLLILIYRKMGLKVMFLSVIMIVLMITFTDQATNIFKSAFERLRPCRTEGVMEHIRFIAERCGKYGFFSGHSSNSMAAAVFGGLLLRPYFKNLIFILLLWSAFVAYSRIYVGVHYPLDIICGLAFGAVNGFGFYKLFGFIRTKYIFDKNKN